MSGQDYRYTYCNTVRAGPPSPADICPGGQHLHGDGDGDGYVVRVRKTRMSAYSRA